MVKISGLSRVKIGVTQPMATQGAYAPIIVQVHAAQPHMWFRLLPAIRGDGRVKHCSSYFVRDVTHPCKNAVSKFCVE